MRMDASSPSEFRPLPLLGNPHVQTLLGTVLLHRSFSAVSQTRVVPLPDGDALALHDSEPAGWRPGDPIAVLLHGLTGSHRSPYIQRLAAVLLRQGFRVVRMDLRGAGHGFRLARRAYHAGISDDLRAALAAVHEWSSPSPLAVVGFSLGGNVTLKLAGEASAAPVPGLAAVVAVGPPIDLGRCVARLTQPRNRFYELHFVRHLVEAAQQRQRLFREAKPVRFPRALTLPIFDDLYTAPHWGFANSLDYYRRASSLPLIRQITLPTLILTARDDPLIAVGPFETLPPQKHIEVHIAERGGHLGFLGWDGAGGIFWAERRIVDWLARVLAKNEVGAGGGH